MVVFNSSLVKFKLGCKYTDTINGNSSGNINIEDVFPTGYEPLAFIPICARPSSTWYTTLTLAELFFDQKAISYRTDGTDAQAYAIDYVLIYK